MIDDTGIEELALRFLSGNASREEAERLSQWRAASAQNESRFRDLEWIWRAAGRRRPRMRSLPPSAEAIIRRAERRRPAARLRAALPAWSRRAAAAAALVVLGFAISRFTANAPAPPALGAVEFATGASEMVTVQLADGSTVRLAPQSRLRVIGGSARERAVWLEGRAFFGVAKEPDRPFVIRTRVGDARVLGTRFDMGVENDDLRLIVVEGRVALSAGGEEVEVAGGEMSVVINGRAPSVVKVDDVHALLGWLQRTLVFQATPLSSVVAELERRFDIRIELRDTALARRTVSAAFTDQPVEDVITVICRVVDARCAIDSANRTVVIEARNPI